MPRRSVPPLALMLIAAAVPAAAQGPVPGRGPFPGIAWGADADAVVRAWGEPVGGETVDHGLDRMDYIQDRKDGTFYGYVLVHPELGTVIAGYQVPFGDQAHCRALARSAFEGVARDYPGFRWGDKASAAAVCAGGERGAMGQDPESGTRIAIRLGEDGELVMDAISPAGWGWVAGGD